MQGLSRVLSASQQGLELGTQEACGQLGALQAPGKEPQVPGGPSGRQESRRNAGRGKRRPRPATNVGERAVTPTPVRDGCYVPFTPEQAWPSVFPLRGAGARSSARHTPRVRPAFRAWLLTGSPRRAAAAARHCLDNVHELLGRKETFKKCSQAHTQRESLLHASQRPRGVQSGPRCLLYSKYADGSAAGTLHTHTTRTSGGLPFFVAAIILGFRSN